jgi:hypothetical protein
MSDDLEEGCSSPLGATPSADGVNFSLFSRYATGVQLLLFDCVDDAKAARVVRLDPSANRTYLPQGARTPWRRWIDTFLDSPHDVDEWERAPLVSGLIYRTESRSVSVLFSESPSTPPDGLDSRCQRYVSKSFGPRTLLAKLPECIDIHRRGGRMTVRAVR